MGATSALHVCAAWLRRCGKIGPRKLPCAGYEGLEGLHGICRLVMCGWWVPS